MTRDERRRLLGDSVIEAIHARVAEAPELPEDALAEVRRILTRPAGRTAAVEATEEQTAA
uniref:hypothetical protein n=1 Tax=Streptomyces sp. NBC_01177 TaxID=2903761 RepID=UPI002F90F532|nr:hypothetical protein OG284_36800 [Streptomyces sp. NBC_01177]